MSSGSPSSPGWVVAAPSPLLLWGAVVALGALQAAEGSAVVRVVKEGAVGRGALGPSALVPRGAASFGVTAVRTAVTPQSDPARHSQLYCLRKTSRDPRPPRFAPQ